MIFTPYDYQLYAENFILEHDGAGLLLDMGMGKNGDRALTQRQL